MRIIILLFAFCVTEFVFAQDYPWQQRVEYVMSLDLDTETHQMQGHQQLIYHNQSPDTISRVYYHLYFNAFQPNSMMDVRSRNIPDPDGRVADRILHLKPEEQGYIRVNKFLQDGKELETVTEGTILVADLDTPILPGQHMTFEMEYTGQVPIMVRRAGRDNNEGIAYSMAQWYPKVCAYDQDGWHPNPYVAREFYGEFGDFDIKITLDSDYIVAASGNLNNAEEIGYGYTDKKVRHRKKDKLTWHFTAENVHDFVWAADPDYTHTKLLTKDSVELHFFYQENEKTRESWTKLPGVMKEAFALMTDKLGPYPYATYAFIQGGDHGMEYGTATLVNGERSIGGLAGTSIHELSHAWFQGTLSTNESLYHWMDEGFTEWLETSVQNELIGKDVLPGRYSTNPYVPIYDGYRKVLEMGIEEPMNTHADHFLSNTAYSMSAYTKGAIFLNQLQYIVGKELFDVALRKYADTWKFRHPRDKDVIRIFEKVSGMELDWYYEYFVNSTKVIEYEVSELSVAGDTATIVLNRLGTMPMPIDLEVTYSDGSVSNHTIPLRLMRGVKQGEDGIVYQQEADWPWTNPSYTLTLTTAEKSVSSVKIDPSLRLADYDLTNNFKELTEN